MLLGRLLGGVCCCFDVSCWIVVIFVVVIFVCPVCFIFSECFSGCVTVCRRPGRRNQHVCGFVLHTTGKGVGIVAVGGVVAVVVERIAFCCHRFLWPSLPQLSR